MTLIPNDLDDDKIRVISAHEPEEPKRNKRFLRVYLPFGRSYIGADGIGSIFYAAGR